MSRAIGTAGTELLLQSSAQSRQLVREGCAGKPARIHQATGPNAPSLIYSFEQYQRMYVLAR